MPGSILKRSRDSWTVIVSYQDAATGKRRQLWRAVRGTKKQAEQELVRLLGERDNGLDRPRGRQTVAQYLERWLEDYVAVNVAPSTRIRYVGIVRRRLIPALGAAELTELRPQHIQALYSRLQRDGGRADGRAGGLSANTVFRIHQVLHRALVHAAGGSFSAAIRPTQCNRRKRRGPSSLCCGQPTWRSFWR